MAASFSCCVVTLLVWRRRRISLADSWTAGSKVVTHCWMSVLVQVSGTSSLREGCGGCRTSARTGGLCAGGGVVVVVVGCGVSPEPEEWVVPFVGVSVTPKWWSFCFARASSSVADLSARRAVPSAGAGECDWNCWMRRLIKGAWKARACVVLLGMSVPWEVWRVSAMASQIEALLPDLLEEMCDKDRFGHTPGSDKAAVFPVAQSSGRIFGRTVICELPGKNVKGGETSDAGLP